MKLKYTCFLYLLLISTYSFSQEKKKSTVAANTKKPSATQNNSATSANTSTAGCVSPLTGVWRGFFTSGSGFFQEKYKYEVQIGQLNTNRIKGVTYSYKTTVFYGKANLAGMYTPSTKNLVLKENKLLEVKMASGDACLMTCYLEYSKVGNTEILEGTFTSINIDNNSDCGSGRVYLEKVPESDFYKEDFVKEYEAKKKNTGTTASRTPQKNNNTGTAKTNTPQVKKDVAKTGTTGNNRNTPKKDVVVAAPPAPGTPAPPPVTDRKTEKVTIPNTSVAKKPTPKELAERDKDVTRVIKVEGEEIQIDLYDNGQIDNDTITVYHNNQVVAYKQRLSRQPISVKVKVDPMNPRNEFVMVADNLGSIPPNTALMVITVGKQHFEVFLTSSLQKSAAVIVDCKVPSDDSKK